MTADHETRTRCAFCDGRHLHQVMDFGEVALAGGFLKPEAFAAERRYPMRLVFCEDCFATQIVDVVPPQTLFSEYFYFSSATGTLREHFRRYAAEIAGRFLRPETASVLELGCNDGVLVRPLADLGIRTVIGVDPAANVVAAIDDPRVRVINAFFDEATAARVLAEHGPMDVVMANNVYAHIPDIQGTTRAVRDVLAPDGVFVFEVHHLEKVVRELQYDMIYHEHLYYYSLLSLQNHFDRYDMVIFDVEPIPIHAGSLRFYVARRSGRHAEAVSRRVAELAARERALGLSRPEAFDAFAQRLLQHRGELRGCLEALRREGRKVVGYGASGRANTILQWCGIDGDLLDCVLDDAPAKWGWWTPGTHLEIRPGSVLQSPDRPDYALVFAWSFFDEIVARNAGYIGSGGRMILPLPHLRIHPPG